MAIGWLVIFGLILLGIFWFIRGNMHPQGTRGIHHNYPRYTNYRTKGVIILIATTIAIYILHSRDAI